MFINNYIHIVVGLACLHVSWQSVIGTPLLCGKIFNFFLKVHPSSLFFLMTNLHYSCGFSLRSVQKDKFGRVALYHKAGEDAPMKSMP